MVEFYVARAQPVLETYLMPVTRLDPNLYFYSSGMHGAQKVENITQYSCAFYRTLFSDYSCSAMEYAVQENQ